MYFHMKVYKTRGRWYRWVCRETALGLGGYLKECDSWEEAMFGSINK